MMGAHQAGKKAVISRRGFLAATSAVAAGSVFFRAPVVSSPATAGIQDAPIPFALFLDDGPGTFSVRCSDIAVVRRACIAVRIESGEFLLLAPRFQPVQQDDPEGTLIRWIDRAREWDITLRARRIEQGLVFRVNLVNLSTERVRLTNVYPVRSLAAANGGLVVGQSAAPLKVLSDSWERCYGDAGVREVVPGTEILSAWDLHLFAGDRILSMSYFEIPNARLSVRLGGRGEDGALDLELRADTRAGRRGVILDPGGSFSLNELVFLAPRGSPQSALEQYAQAIARRNAVVVPEDVPVGWVDWYFSFAKTTESVILDNLDLLARELRDFGLRYVQIDSGWQIGVETTPPPHNVIAGGPWVENSAFSRGMPWFARQIRARGLTPGIWIRPFHMIDGAEERVRHPEWFNSRGQMDLSHPAVRGMARQLVENVTREWGYDYVKYDFPAYDHFGVFGPQAWDDAAAVAEPYDQHRTGAESYRSALEAMAAGATDRARFLACNSVMPSTLGLASSYRIGDDVGDWDRTFRYGVRSVAARWYTNGIYWANDPDCLLVREPFTIDQARLWASVIALTGGIVFVSENLVTLPAERLAIIKSVLPVYGRQGPGYRFGRPVDLLEHDPPRLWHLRVERPFGAWSVAGVFNWSDEPLQERVDFARFGFRRQTRILVHSFWDQRFVGEYRGSMDLALAPHSGAVISLREAADHPQVVGTTRHVTQGGVELDDVRWDRRSRTLSGKASAVAGFPYSLRVHVPPGFRVREVPGIPTEREGGILRFPIGGDKTAVIDWMIGF